MEYARQEQGREKAWNIDNLSDLRKFSGSPDQFWPTFLENAARLAGAVLGLLMVKMKEGESWKAFGIWPGKSPEFSRTRGLQKKSRLSRKRVLKRAAARERPGRCKASRARGSSWECAWNSRIRITSCLRA